MPLQWRNQIGQSLEEGAGKRCFGGRCRKAMLWRKVPESDALEEGAGKRCSECALVSVPGKLSHAHRHFREATSAKRSPALS